jgi:hypothetical protein
LFGRRLPHPRRSASLPPGKRNAHFVKPFEIQES